jgi:hypothetical protein
MSDEIPTVLVQRKDEGDGWEVLIIPTEKPIRILGFRSQSQAKAWAEQDAPVWLAAHLSALR